VEGAFARNHRGTGLGLPLVKRHIELHDGSFILTSELGKGTIATVHFPISRIILTGEASRQSLSSLG
jgi:signal transduction histidine kinase